MSKGLSFLQSATVALVMLGVVFPSTLILAGEQKRPSPSAVKYLPANSILDVSLAKDGTLSGRTTDHAGAPIEGAKVVVRQDPIEVAQTVTDRQGNFSVKNLKTGVYEISSGATAGAYRLWSEQTAPPAAKPNCLLVMGENGARGQYGFFGPNSGTFLVLGLAAIPAVLLPALVINADRNPGSPPVSP